MSGVLTVPTAGQGIRRAYDCAGRALASQSSPTGPVTLVVDIPLALSCL